MGPALLLLLGAALLGRPAPAGGATGGTKAVLTRVRRHDLQPYLRVLAVGDGSTVLAAPPAGKQRAALSGAYGWPDPWGARDPEPPLTYRKALWQILRRREGLAVQFIGSQRDSARASAQNGQMHEGYPGATASQLAGGEHQAAGKRWQGALGTKHAPDVAVLCVGFGDLHRRPDATTAAEDLLASLTSLIQTLHKVPRSNTTTLVCRIPLPSAGTTCKVPTDCLLLAAVLRANTMLPAWAADLEQRSSHPVRIVPFGGAEEDRGGPLQLGKRTPTPHHQLNLEGDVLMYCVYRRQPRSPELGAQRRVRTGDPQIHGGIKNKELYI